jgi:gliding motility-associated-like protein
MKLSVSSEQCPSPLYTVQQIINVDEPARAMRYPVNYAVVNLPLSLRARPIGVDVIWSPPIHLDNASSYTPVFVSGIEQLYTITLKTLSGCVTVDTQLVKINKSIVIFVPNSFTPNNDGLNDILRPFMIGIKELSYFKIFNRWGQLIYQTSKLQDGWDGRLKGVPLGTQTLVWMLEGIGADNKKYQAKGTTILLH